MLYLPYTLCMLLASLPAYVLCNVLQKPIVDVEMGKAGFHRELVYTVQFDYPLAGRECEFILEQVLPAALYINTDELNELKRLKKLDAIYPSVVNIEAITEDSSPFIVLLKGLPKITNRITLPIHFRYHAASEKSSMAVVDIEAPLMYLNCHEARDINEDILNATPDVLYCLHEKLNSFKKYNSSSEAVSTSANCKWKLLSIDYQLTSPLSGRIPRGNKNAYQLIFYATIILSWVVSLLTVLRTKAVPRQINTMQDYFSCYCGT